MQQSIKKYTKKEQSRDSPKVTDNTCSREECSNNPANSQNA